MAVIKIEGMEEAGKSTSSKKKMIYIALVVILNAVTFIVIYMTFFSSNGSNTPYPGTAVFVATPGNEIPLTFNSAESLQAFVNQLSQDLKILNDPRYQLLRSLGVKIPTATSGRENPFSAY